MSSPHQPQPARRSAKPSRRRSGAAVAGILVAASLGAAGCGSAAAPTILNTEKVERAIEQSSLSQRGQTVHASCPSGVRQQNGLQFSCTVLSRGITTRFVVTELDGLGHVHYVAR